MALVYVIVPSADLTQAMVDVCQQDSLATVRKSLDGTDAVLKFDGTGGTPTELTGYTQYTHAEILAEMSGSAWQAGLY